MASHMTCMHCMQQCMSCAISLKKLRCFALCKDTLPFGSFFFVNMFNCVQHEYLMLCSLIYQCLSQRFFICFHIIPKTYQSNKNLNVL